MNRHNLILTILVVSFNLTFAAEELKYPVSSIPDSLKKNAKAVIRNSEQSFEIKSSGKGVFSLSYTCTILNENGLRLSMLIIPYSQKLHRIHSIRGAIYDISGKKIESLMLDRVVDQSMIAGYSLYEDTRVKYFKPKTLTYPFTVEYSFVMEFDGLLSIPEWNPLNDYNVSVEKSKYTIICASGVTFRYQERNIPDKPEIIQKESESIYKWTIGNLPAYISEPFSGPHDFYAPVVYAAPDNFELEGYQGNLSSWTDFGKWGNLINNGRDQLDQATVELIKEKTRNCSTEIEKARIVYEYMQQKTRYLNIAEGIGGWQTQPAETVDRLGYGDCKALSNYTRALLMAAGVKSYYAWIRAGENTENIESDFPINQFNHQILCIPTEKDTIWLECTSQHIPFGFIGDFTDDRKALMITEEGGKLVNTTIYSADENRLDRKTEIVVGETGDVKISLLAQYKGIRYDNRMRIFLAGTEDKKRMILDEINIPGTEIITFKYSENRDRVPRLTENIELSIQRYATVSGTRILVPLIALDRRRDIPKKVNNRKSEVVIRRSSMEVDSITVEIPDGFAPEVIPAEINAISKFGNYSLSVRSDDDNKIVCIRTLKLIKGIHPASTYSELVDFYKKIAVSDNMKVSLKRI